MKRALIILLSVIVIGVVIIKIFYVPKDKSGNSASESSFFAEEENAPNGLIIDDSRLANIQSDINGWTMKDKLDAGLIPKEGADSDGDGLSDKEEIEIYGSDPAKASTAGDLYLDGYKITHGMDLSTSYDYKEDAVFKNNNCNNDSYVFIISIRFYIYILRRN